jgi:hypothetical protein
MSEEVARGPDCVRLWIETSVRDLSDDDKVRVLCGAMALF